MDKARHLDRRALQRERLAQLNDDNAFVDVATALRHVGGEDAWDGHHAPVTHSNSKGNPSPTSGATDVRSPLTLGGGPPSGGLSTSGALPAAVAVATARTTGTSRGPRKAAVGRGTRATEDALLNGTRIPLTASLLDQHKAYLETIRLVAKKVEWNSDSSSHRSSSKDASDTDNDDAERSAHRADLRRTVADGQGNSDQEVFEKRRRGTKGGRGRRPVIARIPHSLRSATVTTSPVIVTSVATNPVAAEETGTSSRKRLRGSPDGSGGGDGAEARERHVFTAEGEASHSSGAGAKDFSDHSEAAEGKDGEARRPINPCHHALADRLNAELRLVEQWRHAMLNCPPNLINGVLSPEAHAPSSPATDGGDRRVHRAGSPEILPYPLLQLYCLCPSYEALTADPVKRRGIIRSTPSTAPVAESVETPLFPVTVPTMTPSKRPHDPLGVRGSAVTLAGAVFTVRGCGCKDGDHGKTPRYDRHHPHLNRHCPSGLLEAGRSGSGAGDTNRVVLQRGVQGARHHHLCSICMLPAAYRCVRCRTALFCSIRCHVLHEATRCLKFTV